MIILGTLKPLKITYWSKFISCAKVKDKPNLIINIFTKLTPTFKLTTQIYFSLRSKAWFCLFIKIKSSTEQKVWVFCKKAVITTASLTWNQTCLCITTTRVSATIGAKKMRLYKKQMSKRKRIQGALWTS